MAEKFGSDIDNGSPRVVCISTEFGLAAGPRASFTNRTLLEIFNESLIRVNAELSYLAKPEIINEVWKRQEGLRVNLVAEQPKAVTGNFSRVLMRPNLPNNDEPILKLVNTENDQHEEPNRIILVHREISNECSVLQTSVSALKCKLEPDEQFIVRTAIGNEYVKKLIAGCIARESDGLSLDPRVRNIGISQVTESGYYEALGKAYIDHGLVVNGLQKFIWNRYAMGTAKSIAEHIGYSPLRQISSDSLGAFGLSAFSEDMYPDIHHIEAAAILSDIYTPRPRPNLSLV